MSVSDPRIAEIKTLTYWSDWYGPVVLTLWGHAVTIQRMDGKGFLVTPISIECLKKINELRGELDPAEVAVAT
jgi:hypothetical protein